MAILRKLLILTVLIVLGGTSSPRADVRFSTAASTLVSPVPLGGQQVDVNGDGRLDQLVLQVVEVDGVNLGLDLVVHLDDGDGHFLTADFSTAYEHYDGISSRIVWIGDLTGDQLPEILISARSLTSGCIVGPLILMVNDGFGGYPTSKLIDTLWKLEELLVEDLGIDGHPDLVIVTRDRGGCDGMDYGRVHVVRNNGDGSFADAVVYPPGGWQTYGPVAVGDLNNDDRPDLILPSLDVYLPWIAEATFGLSVALPPTPEVDWAEALDLEGDGRTDVVLGNASQLMLVHQDSTGSFSLTTQNEAVPGTSRRADFDANGRMDLVVCDETTCRTLVNQGNGSVAIQAFTSVGFSNDFDIDDVDSDGFPDVVVGSATDYHFLFSNGDGTFDPTTFPGATGPAFRFDFDADGVVDYGLFSGAGQLVLHRGGRTFASVFLGLGDPLLTDFERDGHVDIILRHGGKYQPVRNQSAGVFTFGAARVGNVVRAEDHDGDGWIDLVTAPTPYVQYVLAGSGSGDFGGPVPAPFTRVLAIADLDHDGTDEAVLEGAGQPLVSDATLNKVSGPAVATRPLTDTQIGSATELIDVAIADFDGDQLDDVAAVSSGDGEVLLFHHSGGEPQFPTSQLISDQLTPTRILAGDFDADGRPDILANGYLDFHVLFRNVATDPFGVLAYVDLGGSLDVVTGEFDSMPGQDLAFVRAGGIDVALSNADGSFTRRPVFEANVLDIDRADMDRDGTMDLVAWTGTVVRVLYNDGAANFSLGPTAPIDGQFLIGDVDTDGYPDLLRVVPSSLRVHRSLEGNGFEDVGGGSFPITDSNWRRTFLHDVTGDGKPDLLSGGVVVLNESDTSTPVYVQEVRITRQEGLVRLSWRVEGAALVRWFTVVRAPAPAGPYESVTPQLLPSKEMSVTDPAAPRDDELWYRILAFLDSGEPEVVWSGQVDAENATVQRARLSAHQLPTGEIEVQYSIPHPVQPADVSLFDVRGRLLRSEVNDTCAGCTTSFLWSAVDQNRVPLSRGVYFLRLRSGPTHLTRRFVLLVR